MLRILLRLLGVYRVYEFWLKRQIINGEMPKHVAIILDGNRRWARRRGYASWMGHEFGANKVRDVLRWCIELGIKTLTVYAFSTENFNRPKTEVDHIMSLAEKEVENALNDREIFEKQVKVKFIGRRDLIPERLRAKIEELERATASHSNYYLNIAFAYGGRAEIVDAAKKLARDVVEGRLRIEDIDEREIEKRLYTSYLPNPYPDLVIRTSGEERLSGFLLWQSAYSELYFIDVFWPDFRKIDFWRAIRSYQLRERRFGR